LIGWLAPVPDNRHKAFCKYCKKEFRAHRTDLRTHARSRKHQKAGDMYFSDTKKVLKCIFFKSLIYAFFMSGLFFIQLVFHLYDASIVGLHCFHLLTEFSNSC